MIATPTHDLCVAGLVYFEVFVPGAHLPEPGEEVFVERARLGLGGALNTASVAAALGVDVLLAHPRGHGLSDAAVADRVKTLGLTAHTWPGRNDPAVSLVFASPEDRAFVSAADFESLGRCGALPAARWVHVPGLVEARYMAAPLAHVRAEGARISVSGSWSPGELSRLATLTSRPWDLLVLNAKEAAAAAGDPREAPARLAGAAHSIIVTAGAEGAFGVMDGVAVAVPADAVEVREFTGAGDAFCAGLLAALLQGRQGAEALVLGCQAAGRILGQHGGVVLDPKRFDDLRGTP